VIIGPTCVNADVPPKSTLITTARKFYDDWNDSDITAAMSVMSEDVVFRDAQYPKPFVGFSAVQSYLQECTESLPGWRFVIDDYSEDVDKRTLGLRWHVEGKNSVPLPFPNEGISFLEFDTNNKLSVVRDMVEPTVKLGDVQLPLLRTVTKILRIK